MRHMWKMWEAVSHRKLKYKWRHGWKGKPGDDFVAFNGDQQIGRIFQIHEPGLTARWFWIVMADGGPRLDWPAAGFEETAYIASRRLEMVYENIKSGKQRMVS
ncbi:hypothetical protein HB775_15315 [Rhizobium leguminosarum bv. trifolii]|nr:hypothetical protein HB775_15315 [Rhizobium leguminosarum bv. trifolii]